MRSWGEKSRPNTWVFNHFPERLHSFINPNYRTKRALCVGAARGINRCLVPVEWSCLEQIADSKKLLRYEGNNCEYTKDYGGKARPNRWVSYSWFKQSELQREDNSIVWLQRERKPLIYSCFICMALGNVNANNLNPANTTRWSNAGLMLARRRRRWDNISPVLGQRVVFAGKTLMFPNRYVLSVTTCIACDGMVVSHELLKPNYKNKLIELSI